MIGYASLSPLYSVLVQDLPIYFTICKQKVLASMERPVATMLKWEVKGIMFPWIWFVDNRANLGPRRRKSQSHLRSLWYFFDCISCPYIRARSLWKYTLRPTDSNPKSWENQFNDSQYNYGVSEGSSCMTPSPGKLCSGLTTVELTWPILINITKRVDLWRIVIP